MEGADIFRSLMEGTENVISAPLLARHVVGERSAKRIGGCSGNEEKGTAHEKPIMHYNAGLGLTYRLEFPFREEALYVFSSDSILLYTSQPLESLCPHQSDHPSRC